MPAFNWTCPHCGRDQSVVDQKYHDIAVPINVGGSAEGNVSACALAIGCANPDCKKTSVWFSVRRNRGFNSNYAVNNDADPLYHRRAIPTSSAKNQPSFVPEPLVEDYTEACLIRDDSPKASATLARRCIQGMIRDFCGIKKATLAKEIEALRALVDEGQAPAGVTHETVDAIDHVRSIGNIGAHMEKEIDLIIPVDPDEAQVLIELIEMLFEEWYVARDTRQRKLAAISKIGADKKQLIADGRAVSNALIPPGNNDGQAGV
ncbi:MAG: DUF4145 domain-containing protein [Sphingomonas sp.]|nr:DUF4145 domain-containing protein [Sphingomonas sp.]